MWSVAHVLLKSQITVFDKLEFDPCVKECDTSTFFGMIEFDPCVKECDMSTLWTVYGMSKWHETITVYAPACQNDVRWV